MSCLPTFDWRSVHCALEVRSVKGFAAVFRSEFMSLCVGCAVAVLKFFRREGRKKIEVFVSVEKGQALPANFGKRAG